MNFWHGGRDSRDGDVWTVEQRSHCPCGNGFVSKGSYVHGIAEEQRLALRKSLREECNSNAQACYDTHEFNDEGQVTKGNPKWEKFEKSVQNLLDLRSTPGSGNQWHAPSDGVSEAEDPYKIMVDCKFTESKSYSITSKMLQDWWDKATELGYHFALPVRLDGSTGHVKEWVTISLDDYAELVETTRALRRLKRCNAKPPGGHIIVCCRRSGHFDRHDNGETEWSR